MGIGMPKVEFNYAGTLESVKKYFVELMGTKEATRLMDTMQRI